VIAFTRAGISVIPHIINAVVCTSAISSGSSCIFLASRTLYGLSQDGHAPRLFQRCNRFGTPWYAVSLSSALMPLAFMSVGSTSSVVFGWFVNITTVAGLIGWIVIEATYLRFWCALSAQNISRESECPPSVSNISIYTYTQQDYRTEAHCSLIRLLPL
jgi:amino acid transporter